MTEINNTVIDHNALVIDLMQQTTSNLRVSVWGIGMYSSFTSYGTDVSENSVLFNLANVSITHNTMATVNELSTIPSPLSIAYAAGGGMYCDASGDKHINYLPIPVTIDNVLIANNLLFGTENPQMQGGGLYLVAGSVQANRLVVSNNAMRFPLASTVNLFTGNGAGAYISAVNFDFSKNYITNSHFFNNSFLTNAITTMTTTSLTMNNRDLYKIAIRR